MSTQRDVAALANVSSASVSRFLGNPESVTPGTAERIQAAIDELGYKVDYSAQCLKTGRYNHIGILAPGIGPFYWEMFYSIQARLGELGYFSTLFFTRDFESKPHNFRNKIPPFLQKKQLDGIVYFPTLNPEDDVLLDHLKAWNKPFLLLDRPFAEDQFAQLYFDNYAAGREAAKAFLERGHRDFLFVKGVDESPATHDRFQGFSDVLAEHGIRLEASRLLNGEYSSVAAYCIARDAFPSLPPFTAVFACNDSSAGGFMRAAREYGLRCPRDYSIIGFDDNPEFAPFLVPPLSSFHQPVVECGKQAAEIMIRLINEEPDAVERRVFTPVFFARESLGPAPSQPATQEHPIEMVSRP